MNNTIEFMKNNISSLIYTEACIEGVNFTFADTEHIIQNNIAAGLDTYGVNVILGLKHAWEFLFDSYEIFPNYDIYAKYNYEIHALTEPEDAGIIRTKPITIAGCDYVPPVPHQRLFENIFETSINTYADRTSQALMMLFLLCKKQIFSDGNKRSSQLIVNHWLAYLDAKFIICIPPEEIDYFHDLLCRFYDGIITIDDITWDAENFIWIL